MTHAQLPAAEAEHIASPSIWAKRLPSLTGMRFIAAALVFFFHSVYESFFSDPHAQSVYAKIFGEGGWAGVGFFFVLSGFVLTWSARQTDTASKFWRRRIFKIYPNHVVTYIAAAILLTYVGGQVIALRPAIENLFLLQSWSPHLSTEISVNPVSWSLSCEALFYLCFPYLLRVVERVRLSRLWWWIAAITVVQLLIPSFATAVFPNTPVPVWAQSSESQFWFIYVLPPIRMLDFIVGIMLARIVINRGRLPFNLWQASVVAVGAYVLASYIPWTYALVVVWVLPAGLLIAAAARADVEGTRSPFRGRVMVFLGEISFAFYLWHRLVITYGHHWLGATRSFGTVAAIAVVLAFLGTNILLSWLLFTLVEKPMMKRFSVARKPVPATPAGRIPAQATGGHDGVTTDEPTSDEPKRPVPTTSS
jgi:mycarose O-acyltransferase